MFDVRERRKFKRILYSKGMLLVLSVVVIFLLGAVWDVYQQSREATGRRLESAAELEELVNRQTALRREIDYLSSDRGIEEEIRNKFEVAKEGEEVLIIVDPQQEETSTQEEVEGGFWKRFFNIF